MRTAHSRVLPRTLRQNAQCKVYSIVEETENARVLCFAPDGTPTDNVFSVLLAS